MPVFKSVTRTKRDHLAEGKHRPLMDLERKPPPAHYKPKYGYVTPSAASATVTGRRTDYDPLCLSKYKNLKT